MLCTYDRSPNLSRLLPRRALWTRILCIIVCAEESESPGACIPLASGLRRASKLTAHRFLIRRRCTSFHFKRIIW